MMGAASKGGGGDDGGDGDLVEGWRAEEAVACNRSALESLRELLIDQRVAALRPPGTGKTSLVQAIRECNAYLTMINTYSVHKAHAGEGEKFLLEAFSEAYFQASRGRPAVIFIDELDAICPRHDSRREQESRIVAQLLALMDGNKKSSKTPPHIVVVASTNKVDAIVPALRRPGRFDSEIAVTVPTVEERLQILEAVHPKAYEEGSSLSATEHHLGEPIEKKRKKPVSPQKTAAKQIASCTTDIINPDDSPSH